MLWEIDVHNPHCLKSLTLMVVAWHWPLLTDKVFPLDFNSPLASGPHIQMSNIWCSQVGDLELRMHAGSTNGSYWCDCYHNMLCAAIVQHGPGAGQRELHQARHHCSCVPISDCTHRGHGKAWIVLLLLHPRKLDAVTLAGHQTTLEIVRACNTYEWKTHEWILYAVVVSCDT